MKSHGCDEIWAKELSENDNSKQQVYIGGDFKSVNFLPYGEVYSDSKGPRKKITYKADLNFYWLLYDGTAHKAKHAKLIWYPKYPEVRFSGFLQGCNESPSSLMQPQPRRRGRVLLFGVDKKENKIFGFLVDAESPISKEFKNTNWVQSYGVFDNIIYVDKADTKLALLKKLKSIHDKRWISATILKKDGTPVPYNGQNAAGTTLEAELGIIPNSINEPDYLGWEIKQFRVTHFEKLLSKKITLMTPEPDGGDYVLRGLPYFVKTYGHPNNARIKDRWDFTGLHRVRVLNSTTDLKLEIEGYDFMNNKIVDQSGRVILISSKGIIAASWSFTKLIDHWERKHNQAAYIPSLYKKGSKPKEFWYGNNIVLGNGTSFRQFITALNYGIIYYDPGINVAKISTQKPVLRKRSQFRFSTSFFSGLYDRLEELDLTQF